MIEFRKTKDPDNQFDRCDVSVKIENDGHLDDVLEAFTDFLRGCGFCIDADSRLDIVNDFEESDDDDTDASDFEKLM